MKLSWSIITTDTFDEWYNSLDNKNRKKVLSILLLLNKLGPHLSRPHTDTINSSKFCNMKELRIKSLRVFYAFTPNRKAILLCAGNKKGKNQKKFYKSMISIADYELQSYIEAIGKE